MQQQYQQKQEWEREKERKKGHIINDGEVFLTMNITEHYKRAEAPTHIACG